MSMTFQSRAESKVFPTFCIYINNMNIGFNLAPRLRYFLPQRRKKRKDLLWFQSRAEILEL